jgi:hypothetical protein
MDLVQLSEEEKEDMARWLSARARAGGWFFMGMAGLVLLMLLWALFAGSRQEPIRSDDLVPVFTLILGLVGTAVFLFRRRQAVRRWLDEPLQLGKGRILAQHPLPYAGYRLQLQISMADGANYKASFGYLGKPDWKVGDDLELIFWQNGRFCPRYIDHIVDFAYLPTEERLRRKRRRVIQIVVGLLILAAFAILMGLYGQGN